MKKLYFILIITTLFISCEKPISDFQSDNFIKMFGSGYKSKGNDVIELSNGGYLITGYDVINDAVNNNVQMIYVAKVDKNGNLIWEKTYGAVKNINEGKVLKELSDGYLLAAVSVNNGISFPVIFKLDSEGNEIFKSELSSNNYSITPLDLLVTDKFIYLVGYSDITKTGFSDYYISKFDLNGTFIDHNTFANADNCQFQKVFSKNSNLLLLGTNGKNNNVSITELNTDLGTFDSDSIGNSESLVDANVSYMGLFALTSSLSAPTKLSLLDDSYNPIWTYKNSDLTAKSLTCRYDGTVMVCAEEEVDQIPYIHFLKISNGTLSNGDAFFKSLPGTVSRMIETKDKGFILIGSTNDTYGMNIQLIKTDKDFYMIKK